MRLHEQDAGYKARHMRFVPDQTLHLCSSLVPGMRVPEGHIADFIEGLGPGESNGTALSRDLDDPIYSVTAFSIYFAHCGLQ